MVTAPNPFSSASSTRAERMARRERRTRRSSTDVMTRVSRYPDVDVDSGQSLSFRTDRPKSDGPSIGGIVNLGRYVRRTASHQPAAEALVCGDTRLTYAEL